MLENLSCCTICAHNCKVNRLNGQIGRCKCSDKIKIALFFNYRFEEPCISGSNGSGSIFFSNCNFNCIYCQNYKISQQGKGYFISIDELADIFINMQLSGAHNINLVTPTMYVYQIIESIKIAKNRGLNIPIIYNTNSYENVETIKLLNGFVDVYLPDLKYFSNELALKYSGISNYFNVATKAIKEMIKQVGIPEFSKNRFDKKRCYN